VNIQDTIWKFCDKKRGEQPHISCKTDQIGFMFIENGGDLAVVDLTLQAFRRNHARGDAARLGARNAGRALAIADDDGDLRVRNPSRRNALRQSLEIRATAAQEHANAFLHKRKTLAQPSESSKLAVVESLKLRVRGGEHSCSGGLRARIEFATRKGP